MDGLLAKLVAIETQQRKAMKMCREQQAAVSAVADALREMAAPIGIDCSHLALEGSAISDLQMLILNASNVLDDSSLHHKILSISDAASLEDIGLPAFSVMIPILSQWLAEPAHCARSFALLNEGVRIHGRNLVSETESRKAMRSVLRSLEGLCEALHEEIPRQHLVTLILHIESLFR